MKEPTEIVYVTWIDSSGQEAWNRALPDEESLTCVSAGFLLEETEVSIVVSASFGCRTKRNDRDDFSADAPMRIPKVAILRMERRKPPKWLTWRLPPVKCQSAPCQVPKVTPK